jgi:2-methylcitrate dehydratase PrpD
MTSLTQAAGEFLANITYDDLPVEVLPMVRDAFTDTLAVIMVGIEEPIADIVRKTLVEPAGLHEARACLSARVVGSPDAALLAGAIAHSLDYDDQSLSGHPSAVLVPAILAEAEALGSSGQQMATAYVAGYEVWSEIWRRNHHYHAKGWHPTSVFGPIAAAAACAVLRQLSAERAATALAIAATHAGGLVSNFPSMTKGYHAGISTRSGLISARLADAGMSAGHDALENEQGFLTAFSNLGDPDRHSESKLGKEWYLPKHKLLIKRHPTCYFMHRSFEATVRMLGDRRIDPDEVESVEVRMGRGQTTVLVYDRPQTRYQAEFSGHYSIAAAVILGRMGVPELADDVVRRPDIQAFLPKVHLIPVDEVDPRDPVFSPTETVTMRLSNGEVIESGPVASIPGHASDPLTREQLWDKFLECTVNTHEESEARTLFDLLQKIDALDSTAQLPTCERIFND